MNPAIPETKGGVGASFKGTAAYLLHDKDAQTDERVAWTETRNLATADPDLAWRVMAATAKDSGRLKREDHERQQAELPEDERTPYRASKSSVNHVFHYSLSWHSDDAPELSREEMMRAALGSLKELKADDLQAMIVAHQDAEHPHVHVMVNRVDPETGKTRAIDSNAARALSRHALKYNRERGTEDQAPMREVNAMRRAQALPYQTERRIPRQIFEQRQIARDEARRNPERAGKVMATERQKDAEIARKGREATVRHRKEWDRLSGDHKRRKAQINAASDSGKAKAKALIAKQYEPQWRALRDAHETERRAMVERERSLAGKIQNTASAIKMLWGDRREADVRKVIAGTFEALGSQGARADVLRKRHAKAETTLARDQKAAIASAVSVVEQARKAGISDNYARLLHERGDLKFKQAADRAALRSQWKTRDQGRSAAWRDFRASERLRTDYKKAASPAPEKAQRAASGAEQTKPIKRTTGRTRTRTRRRE